MSCSDIRERFHLLFLLTVVGVRNLTEFAWNLGETAATRIPFTSACRIVLIYQFLHNITITASLRIIDKNLHKLHRLALFEHYKNCTVVRNTSVSVAERIHLTLCLRQRQV